MSKRSRGPTEDPELEGGSAPAPAPDEQEALRAERDELAGKWQRALADYQNLKRRTQGEIEGSVRQALQPLLDDLLLVIDHLDLALSTPIESEDANNLAQGVRMTRNQLLANLQRQGVEVITAESTFDPALHEAVATVEREDLEPGEVVEVVRRGYTWRGQVLRHAHVKVARRANENAPPPADPPAPE